MEKESISPSTLVISCVDFRMRKHHCSRILDDHKHHLGLEMGEYDELCMMGASLAYSCPEKTHWKKTMDDTIQLLVQNHDIQNIILVDHLDCLAYKEYSSKKTNTRKQEREAHLYHATKTKKALYKKYPDLEISCFLMDVDGSNHILENEKDNKIMNQ